jgi:predicted nucleotidyltransferase
MLTYTNLGALFSRTRSGVLAVLALATEQELHVREIARRSGLSAPGAADELRSLEELGILTARRVGRQKLYRMNPDSPIYAELTSIMRKTAGLADQVRAALQPLAGRIELAYIYGSMASGKARSSSDVDVMVVGSISSMDVAEALDDVSRRLGREINATVYAAEEYARKVSLGRGFPFTAHSGARIMLLGSADESK